jgi:TrpR-related protein YerC/YecD
MHSLRFKLNKRQQEELFINFARSLALLKNSTEVAQFLKDLLSEIEIMMFARRLQIAELLLAGSTYEQIRQAMKVSKSTIARVQTWLDIYGEGYRIVINRSSKHKEVSNTDTPWSKIKRKYPQYYWPQLLLEEIVKSANKREKQRLIKVVEQLKDKTALSKQLMKLL